MRKYLVVIVLVLSACGGTYGNTSTLSLEESQSRLGSGYVVQPGTEHGQSFIVRSPNGRDYMCDSAGECDPIAGLEDIQRHCNHTLRTGNLNGMSVMCF